MAIISTATLMVAPLEKLSKVTMLSARMMAHKICRRRRCCKDNTVPAGGAVVARFGRCGMVGVTVKGAEKSWGHGFHIFTRSVGEAPMPVNEGLP